MSILALGEKKKLNNHALTTLVIAALKIKQLKNVLIHVF